MTEQLDLFSEPNYPSVDIVERDSHIIGALGDLADVNNKRGYIAKTEYEVDRGIEKDYKKAELTIRRSRDKMKGRYFEASKDLYEASGLGNMVEFGYTTQEQADNEFKTMFGDFLEEFDANQHLGNNYEMDVATNKRDKFRDKLKKNNKKILAEKSK